MDRFVTRNPVVESMESLTASTIDHDQNKHSADATATTELPSATVSSDEAVERVDTSSNEQRINFEEKSNVTTETNDDAKEQSTTSIPDTPSAPSNTEETPSNPPKSSTETPCELTEMQLIGLKSVRGVGATKRFCAPKSLFSRSVHDALHAFSCA